MDIDRMKTGKLNINSGNHKNEVINIKSKNGVKTVIRHQLPKKVRASAFRENFINQLY